MKLHFLDEYIPGTKLKKAEMENLTGLDRDRLMLH